MNIPTSVYRALLDHLIHIAAHQKATERLLEKAGVPAADFKAAYSEERKKLQHLLDQPYDPKAGLDDRGLSILLRQLQAK